MAENVVLSVQLDGAQAAIAQLTQLDNLVKSLKTNKNIKISVSAKSLTTAAENADKLSAGLQKATASAKSVGTTGAKSIDNAGKSLQGASKNAESFRNGMGNVLTTMLKFRVVSTIINLVATALKEAITEMKNVDTELVNIRKVTGYASDEIEKLSRSAYSLATNYGRAASEVLTASTVFARAGYTEQISQLSELSLLLQNVGDLEADDAAKFLIATDKAYKLGGSYEDLMTVIDGLDNITNKNATDMQKLTDGMTIAGSVFAESGESIETFAALLGTATADTQRGGSEIARGLRTILMNLRQIRGETEDGELIDGESIANAAKALKDYAGISTMENGQLRKASDVLEELAGKWDTLTEVQQSAIAEAVAGKRQANVLMTLMGDWESVEKMLGEYQNGAGTAARENAIYMDSWAAKTEQVKAAWNELISTILSSDGFKSLLDTTVNLLNALTKIAESSAFNKLLDLISWGLNSQIESLNLVTDAVDYLFSTWDERISATQAKMSGLTEEIAKERELYADTFGNSSRYAYLLSNVDQLTDKEKTELAILESEKIQLERIIELKERELAIEEEKLRKQEQNAINERNKNASHNLSDFGYALEALNRDLLDTGDVREYRSAILELIGSFSDEYKALQELKASGKELTDQEQRFIDVYELASRTIVDGGKTAEVFAKNAALSAYAYGDSAEDASKKANEAVEEVKDTLERLPSVIPVQVQVSASWDDVSGALLGFGSSAGSALGALGNAKATISALQSHAQGTSSAPGGAALVNENGPEMISANGLAWIAGGGKPTVTMLPKGATVLTASETRNALGGKSYGALPAYDDGLVDPSFFDRTAENERQKAEEAARQAQERGKRRTEYEKSLLEKGVYGKLPTASGSDSNTTGGSGSGGYYSSGPVAPNFAALEDALTAQLKTLDAQAKLAENEEDYLKAITAYGQAQAAIAELLDQYRENGYADDSDEVLRLANLGYDYASKQIGSYDKLQQNLIDALNALTESTDKANELQEKRDAVEKAREALANAERQRTVRIFNPVTGQWEWVANASDIAKAQENLQKAEENLRKEELSQAVDAIKNASPSELGNMTLSPAVLEALLGASPEQQSAFLNALGAATGGADWLSSPEGQTQWNQGTSIGTQYNLAGITLTEQMASGMTIKELIYYLQTLKVM